MNDAALALRLLLCEDPERAQQMAKELSEKNQERQTAEQEIMQQAQQQLTAHPERTSVRFSPTRGITSATVPMAARSPQ